MTYELLPRKLFRLARNPFNFPDLFEDMQDPSGLLSSNAIEQTGLELSEDDKHVYVKASLPGLNPENIDITLEKGILQIKGEKNEEEKSEKKKYYRKAQRSFWYQVALPSACDESQEPKATYKNGVLELHLQKTKPAQAKKINIKNS